MDLLLILLAMFVVFITFGGAIHIVSKLMSSKLEEDEDNYYSEARPKGSAWVRKKNQ